MQKGSRDAQRADRLEVTAERGDDGEPWLNALSRERMEETRISRVSTLWSRRYKSQARNASGAHARGRNTEKGRAELLDGDRGSALSSDAEVASAG